MKRQIKDRRTKFTNVYCQTWSIKTAIEVVAKEFNVSEATIRVDWSRRLKWPKEVFENLKDPFLLDVYHQGIHRTLRQVEWQLTKIKNPNCIVGLLKTKADILFKLMDFQKHIINEEKLLTRIENLEKTVQLMKSQKRDKKVNKN